MAAKRVFAFDRHMDLNLNFETGARFIPSSLSSLAYHYPLPAGDHEIMGFDSPPDCNRHSRDAPSSSSVAYTEGGDATPLISFDALTETPSARDKSVPKGQRNDHLADALGFSTRARVLAFQTLAHRSTERPLKISPLSLEIAGPLLSCSSQPDLVLACSNSRFSFTDPRAHIVSKTPPRIIHAINMLQAPGLRNDFYSNLVSWSYKSSKISVGLSSQTYLWGIDNIVEAVPLDNTHTVTATACSTFDYMVAVTCVGHIFLCDLAKNTKVSLYLQNNQCLYCVQWIPLTHTFIAGDDIGNVHIYDVVNGHIILRTLFKSHQQQICGIAINNDNSQAAIGGNDNSCSVWNIEDLNHPVRQFVLPHNAAVKAIAFCPWTKLLLATGGGLKDRKIRFWHTQSGTMLSEHSTAAQITSLVWSWFKREVAATFGFGCGVDPLMICVYAYPSMQPVLQAPSKLANIRVLGSTLSPDGQALAVAVNDLTIRIYHLWNKTLMLHPATFTENLSSYGSQLIELNEGMAWPSRPLR